jgi:glyoxylase-like metal-dependent hydrolase (beta-lactamase superfamily II)
LQGGSWRSVEFPAICALIIHPTRGPVLYDTGYSDHFIDATQAFPERLYRWLTPIHLPQHERLEHQLEAHGYALSDVGACLISHFHADHIAGIRDLPNAQFHALRSDVSHLLGLGRINGLRKGLLPSLLPPDFQNRTCLVDHARIVPATGPWTSFGSAFDIFGDQSVLAIALPGHSDGQMGLLFRDQNDREVFLCADACWSRAAWETLRYPSLITRLIMSDWKKYLSTLNKIHQLGAQHPEVAILPSHCQISLNRYGDATRPRNVD